MAISNQTADEIDHEIGGTPMPSVFDLRNIFQLVNYRFNDGALSGQKFVGQPHQLIFHMPLGLGEELNTKVFQQFLRQRLRDIASVRKNFAEQTAEQVGHGFAVVSVTRCHGQV